MLLRLNLVLLYVNYLLLQLEQSGAVEVSAKNARKCASFSKKRGYPDSAVITGKHRAQEIDRETALQTSQNKETDRITFTLTYHPQNLAIKMKNVILKNFSAMIPKLNTFSLPPLISFKRDKNVGNFLVRGAFKFNDQPGTFTSR